MPSYNSFEELECWQKCRRVRIWVEKFLNDKIDNKDFDMVQNLRRAARSTTRNIAEGFGRFHFKENIQFCRISRGSLFEIKDDLIICLDKNKVTQTEIAPGIKLVNEALHSVNGYIKYLNSKTNNQ
ncbi:four helix bundle protein [Flagellimonas myxillae]|uniref:four helix bundle protein n=1 Tax=Flagellimonas myxillae TaxID=2942214 RepID=UPI00201EDF23|nr:four helix bundle protein [Muricauda myxillae]MCL6268280.1 four helix bundle protein [Muricauda myxillae]